MAPAASLSWGMAGLFAGTPLERPVTCERCGLPYGRCTCPRGSDGKILLPQDQKVRVQRESRRGKTVTVVTGLDPKASDPGAILKQLRTALGAGGTVDGGTIEVQGDHREKVLDHLRSLGYRPKASGG